MHDERLLEIRRAYRTLNVDFKAAEVQIKLAYRTAMKHWHPDRWLDQPQEYEAAVAKAQEMSSAYQLIKHAPMKNGSADAPPPIEKSPAPQVKKKRLPRKKRSPTKVAEPVTIHVKRHAGRRLIRPRNLVMSIFLVVYVVGIYLFVSHLENLDVIIKELSAGLSAVAGFIGMVAR